MKRIQEKVKDIVEVRPYNSIRDFVANPAETLNNYHFTDATADLMAKWLDGVAAVQGGRGAAFALAGYRGVGKSHFLATLAALAANPDLRTRVSEPHVGFSAQRLHRRHYTVAYLRRGEHKTLQDEFISAIKAAFALDGLSASMSYAEMLKAASEKSGDVPFILMIDTAFERGSRVTRDDGIYLSEIAEAAKKLNVFVGVALDDDIASADGSNSSIAKSFSIDYLDQAHLYKVVNSHIFPKHNQMQPVLRDIYAYFREVLPSFRWSEQKFSSLYPLHPAILEIAPYVRLYVHDFALLGFASEAGERILGRPSNSLIALDEVYDSGENGLRKIEDLAEAFAAYDKLNSSVVGKIPVMQRLQAKLILKALLLLSLDGQGATASDICASVLIFDESDPQKAVRTVEDLLKTFAAALPSDFRVVSDEGVGERYSFKVSSKENLNNALAEAVKAVSVDKIPDIMRRVFQERFTDSVPATDVENTHDDWIESQIVWRGGVRRGRIVWSSGAVSATPERTSSETMDWEVFIDRNGSPASPDVNDVSKVIWKPDALRPDEIDKMRSYYALSTNRDLQEKFSEQIRASVHAHSIVVEKIVNRSFLEDGNLVIDGFDYNFTEEARSAPSLSTLFSAMLEPLFETRYSSHPYFSRTLDYPDVAAIITDLYNNTRQDLEDVQDRARTFAFPLGLVRLEGNSYVPEDQEKLAALPLVGEIITLVDASADKPVSLNDVCSQLRKSPYGLVREAQQMILTALVAQRQIEFVTSSENRINKRSLDLKIIWDDIVGIARPIENSFSLEKVKRWASLFLETEGFQSLDRSADQNALQAALGRWSSNWKQSGILERFAQLPDDVLNVRTWQIAARISKTFGSVAEMIGRASEGVIPLEDCLDAVADAFSGSEKEFHVCEKDLDVLSNFIRGAELRDEIRSYLAVCEITSDPDIELLRERVLALVAAAYWEPGDRVNEELGITWESFKHDFAEYFAERHSEAMNSWELKEQLRATLQSDQWWEFENLSDTELFDPRIAIAVSEHRRRINELDCRVDTLDVSGRQPFCICSFSLSRSSNGNHLPAALDEQVAAGLRSFRSALVQDAESFITSIERLASEESDKELREASTSLIQSIKTGKDIPPFTDIQLKILRRTVGSLSDHKFFGQLESNPPLIHPSTKVKKISREISDDQVLIDL